MAVDQGEADQPLEPLPHSQRLPAYLLRTLQASWPAGSSPADVLLLAAHAAMLETGFVPHWPAGSSSSSTDPYGVPPSCWASSSVCRIQYTLQPSNGDDGSSSAMEDVAASEAEAGAAAEQQAAAGPACTLQCSSMGGGAVVLAVSTQLHARHLALRAGAFVQPPARGAAAASPGGDGAGPSSSGAAATAAAGTSSAVRQLPDGGLALGSHLQLSAAAAKQLWTRLKDGLAFPMLLAAYVEAGLAPPAGLLALPEELKQRVLEGLGVSGWVLGRWLVGKRGACNSMCAVQGSCTGARLGWWAWLCRPGAARGVFAGSAQPSAVPAFSPFPPLPCSRTTWPRCAAPAASCATWPLRTACGARCLRRTSRVPRSGTPST